MKKLAVGTVVALAIATVGPALAADLARKPVAAATVAPAVWVPNWTGLYLGAHGGCGRLNQRITRITVEDDEPPETAFVNIATTDKSCFWGGQIGYNIHFPNNIVLGVEGDGLWGSFKASGVAPEGEGPLEIIPYNHKLKSIFTVRGRVGYAFGQWLPYITGGWARGTNELTVFAIDDLLTTSDRQRHSGWVFGGGLEFLLNQNWSVKAEYLHMDLGSKTYNGVAFFDAFFPGADLELTVKTFKLGINFKFGG